MSNPDVPLGNAEQFLLTMSSINELAPRLHLWSFKLDYDQLERVRKNFGIQICWTLQCTAVTLSGGSGFLFCFVFLLDNLLQVTQILSIAVDLL